MILFILFWFNVEFGTSIRGQLNPMKSFGVYTAIFVAIFDGWVYDFVVWIFYRSIVGP